MIEESLTGTVTMSEKQVERELTGDSEQLPKVAEVLPNPNSEKLTNESIAPAMAPKPIPLTQMRLVNKSKLKQLVKSHGLQLGTDFYHALNDTATRLTLQAMYRMMEKGWRVRLGVQDL